MHAFKYTDKKNFDKYTIRLKQSFLNSLVR